MAGASNLPSTGRQIYTRRLPAVSRLPVAVDPAYGPDALNLAV